jgi:hypothetical protein
MSLSSLAAAPVDRSSTAALRLPAASEICMLHRAAVAVLAPRALIEEQQPQLRCW